jgi:hypothetical protein
VNWENLKIFSGADADLVKLIKSEFGKFESLFGLKANPSKSVVFCAAIQDEEK